MPTIRNIDSPRFVVIACAVVTIAIVFIGCVAKDEPADAQREYCNNVRDGLWPDYQGTYKSECGGKEPPKFDADLTKK